MRELDWRIHEYMGNDLTGWEWDPIFGSLSLHAVKVTGMEVERQVVPRYSTTWEGAGLVMEWMNANSIVFHLRNYMSSSRYEAVIGGKVFNAVNDESAPLALAKAYISAMEERDNERS